MALPTSTPEIDAARAQVAALQQQIDVTLPAQIQAAIQAADAPTVRTLRASRDGLLSQIYAAKVALKNLEIPFYQASRTSCATTAQQLSAAAQAQFAVAQAAKDQAEVINQQCATAYEIQQGFERQLYRATDALTAIQTAEMARLRNVADAAY